MNIASHLIAEIVAHALEDPSIECCGLVAVESAEDGAKTATRVYRARNIHASPLKFQIDPMEQYRLNQAIEEAGWEIGAIYHSHVRSEPKPSQTDITFAAKMGDIEWIIVGLEHGGPEVRSYVIDGGNVERVPIDGVPIEERQS